MSLHLLSESRIINSVRAVMGRWAKKVLGGGGEIFSNFPTDKYFSVCFLNLDLIVEYLSSSHLKWYDSFLKLK